MTTKLIENGHAPKVELAGWDRQWRREFLNAKTKHVFLLHGNTQDYTYGEQDLRTHLRRAFATYPIVIVYNRAEGIMFSDELSGGGVLTIPEADAPPSMRQQFMELLGVGGSMGGDDLAALAELGGSAPAGPPPLPRDPMAALPLIDVALRQKAVKIAVIVDYLESLAPAANVAQMNADDRTVLILLQRWAIDPQVASNGHPVILIASVLGDVNPALRAPSARLSVIGVPIPSFEDRLGFVTLLSQANEKRPADQRWDMQIDPAEFARLTAGLGRVHLGEIVREALGSGRAVDRALVLEVKSKINKAEFDSVLESMDPTDEDDWDLFGGADHVKEYFDWAVVEPMREGRYEDCPMGILLTGPAGTGKSFFARCLARRLGVNAFQFAPGKILGKFVGDTQKALDKALHLSVAAAPTILFIDELDNQVKEDVEGDSGVSDHIFGRLKEFMADTSHRGKVLVLAASNQPSKIPAALKRPGRMDAKIPFLAPEREDRQAIVLVHMKQLLGDDTAGAVASSVAGRTEGYTGAELFRLTQKASELLKRKRADSIADAYDLALDTLMPSTNAIAEMTREALAEMDDLDLIPPRLHDLARKLRAARPAAEKQAPAQVAPAESVDRLALAD